MQLELVEFRKLPAHTGCPSIGSAGLAYTMSKRALESFGTRLVPLVLLLPIACLAESPPELAPESITYDEWGISRIEFCPGEAIVIRVQLLNHLERQVPLKLCTFESERGLIRVTREGKELVWDSETHVLQKYALENQFEPNYICVDKNLGSEQQLAWQFTWQQIDNSGQPVAPGKYQIDASLRWLATNEGRKPIAAASIVVKIRTEGCD